MKDDNWLLDCVDKIKRKKRELNKHNTNNNRLKEIKSNLDKQYRSAKRANKQHLKQLISEGRYDEL